jgi:hypothetical protein
MFQHSQNIETFMSIIFGRKGRAGVNGELSWYRIVLLDVKRVAQNLQPSTAEM